MSEITPVEAVAMPRLFAQMAKFGIVGIAATLMHVAVFVSLIESTSAAPLLANTVAFCVAFTLSFFGHFWWTFSVPAAESRRVMTALLRFVAVALAGFLLNTAAVFVVVDLLTLSYVYAVVLLLTVVPASVFVISKCWAFA